MIETLKIERINHHISDFDDEELWEFHKGEANYYKPNNCELLNLSEEQKKSMKSWKTYYSAIDIEDYYISICENSIKGKFENGRQEILGYYDGYVYYVLENHFYFWKIKDAFYVQKIDYICVWVNKDYKWMYMENNDIDKFKYLGTWDKVLEYYETNIKEGSKLNKEL